MSLSHCRRGSGCWPGDRGRRLWAHTGMARWEHREVLSPSLLPFPATNPHPASSPRAGMAEEVSQPCEVMAGCGASQESWISLGWKGKLPLSQAAPNPTQLLDHSVGESPNPTVIFSEPENPQLFPREIFSHSFSLGRQCNSQAQKISRPQPTSAPLAPDFGVLQNPRPGEDIPHPKSTREGKPSWNICPGLSQQNQLTLRQQQQQQQNRIYNTLSFPLQFQL